MIFIFLISSAISLPIGLENDELIDYVNSHQSLWEAGVPRRSREKIMNTIMDSKFSVPNESIPILKTPPLQDDLSTFFDARERWPECASIQQINDQSECKSGWAFAAAESMSDRHCIHSGGRLNTILSAQELISCCSGLLSCGQGCDGGYVFKAWEYWTNHGLVTGGSYATQFGCKPYSIAPCGKTVGNVTYPACKNVTVASPTCEKKCTSKNSYPIAYEKDRHYGTSYARLDKNQIEIQSDLMMNGPLESTIDIYEDFLTYTTGIYVHLTGAKLGTQAVRIIGWGMENGVPYWLLANSWGTDWGENGFFRVLRGVNECGIEGNCVSGMPDLSR